MNGVNGLTFLINEVKVERLFCGADYTETCGWRTELGAFDGLYLATQRGCRIDNVINRTAFGPQVLKVVNMTTGIYVDFVFTQNGVDQALHVLTFGYRFAGFGINGVMAHHYNPVFFGCSERTVEPLHLTFD